MSTRTIRRAVRATSPIVAAFVIATAVTALFGSPASAASCTPAPRAYLVRCDFHGRGLAGRDLHRANLTRANFTGANLTNARVSGSNVPRANFTGATLRGLISGRL